MERVPLLLIFLSLFEATDITIRTEVTGIQSLLIRTTLLLFGARFLYEVTGTKKYVYSYWYGNWSLYENPNRCELKLLYSVLLWITNVNDSC